MNFFSLDMTTIKIQDKCLNDSYYNVNNNQHEHGFVLKECRHIFLKFDIFKFFIRKWEVSLCIMVTHKYTKLTVVRGLR